MSGEDPIITMLREARLPSAMDAISARLAALETAVGRATGNTGEVRTAASELRKAGEDVRKATQDAASTSEANRNELKALGTQITSAATQGILRGCLGIFVFVAIAATTGWWAGTRHLDDEVAAAQAQTQADIAAAAAWAGTPAGQRAHRLDQAGSLERLANCQSDGWKIEKQKGRSVCRPTAGDGWFLD
jgi:hypothetical protein